jgi:hypothetical protein
LLKKDCRFAGAKSDHLITYNFTRLANTTPSPFTETNQCKLSNHINNLFFEKSEGGTNPNRMTSEWIDKADKSEIFCNEYEHANKIENCITA